MKKRLTTSTCSSSPSSSVSSSTTTSSPIQSEAPRPKRAKRAKKSSPSGDKSHNPTSPASTRRSSIYRGVTRFLFFWKLNDWLLRLDLGFVLKLHL